MTDHAATTTTFTADGIDFTDAVGLLWYTLFSEQKAQSSEKERRMKTSRSRSDPAGTEAQAEPYAIASSPSSSPSPAAAAAIDSATSTTNSPTSVAENALCVWGDVDWVLLAAHVYALTRELHSAAALRRLVAQELFARRFHLSQDEMTKTLGGTHARVVSAYAQYEVDAATRASAAPPLSTSSAPAANAANTSADASAFTSAPLGSSATSTSQDGARVGGGVGGGAHSRHLPVTAGLNAAAALPIASVVADSARGTTAVGSDANVSLQGQFLPSAPLPHTTPATATPAPQSSATHTMNSEIGSGSASSPSFSGHTAAGAAVGQTTQLAGSTDSSAFSHASSSGAGRGAVNGKAIAPVAEADPLDAPWYTLFCSLPSLQARMHLRRLRFHTPIPIEDFSALLEQFFLVDGADDFLSPVHASTIMEFAGVRSGPYHSIVRAPLSLAEVRRYITESHRHFTRAAAAAAAAHGEHSGSSGVSGGGSSDAHHHHQQHTRVVSAGHTQLTAAATATPADTEGLLRRSTSDVRRVLTLAELERSIWHIAANCVVFNAPESRYPRSARRFATSCVGVILRYCEKQLAPFLSA